MVSERSQNKKLHTILFHLYDILENNKKQISKCLGSEGTGLIIKGHRLTLWSDGNFSYGVATSMYIFVEIHQIIHLKCDSLLYLNYSSIKLT